MNPRRSRKPTVEEVIGLTVSTLREFKPLGADQTSSATISWSGPFDAPQSVSITMTPSRLFVAYNVAPDQKSAVAQTIVPITRTACHFGKDRPWFICPACGRRCGVLYWPDAEHILACRICYGLGYQSQIQSKGQRQVIRMLDDAFAKHDLLMRLRRKGPGRKPSLRQVFDRFCQ